MSFNYRQQNLTFADFENSTDGNWSPALRTPLLDAVNTVIACLAVLGNGMVITVMLVRRRVFSSYTNRLILHQSVIDSIAGVVFVLYTVVLNPIIVVSAEGNIYDQLACRLVASDFLLWCMNVTSTYNIVIISLERFMATCHPVRHRNTWSMAKLKFALLTPWAIGFVYGLHYPFFIKPHQKSCLLTETGIGWTVFHLIVVVGVEFVVPLTMMAYAYIRILMTLTKKLSNPINGRQNVMSKAKKDVLITTLLIGIMLVVCWTPVEIYFIIQKVTSSYGGPLYIVFKDLVACNMFVNPIIYCFKYKHFRFQLKDIVLKRRRRNRVHNREPILVPSNLSSLQ